MTTHTDLIARLREWALPDPHDEREVMNAPLLRRTADALESLEQQVAALTNERNDLLILLDNWKTSQGVTEDQLVAAQARESKLRKALELALAANGYGYDACRCAAALHTVQSAQQAIENALALPTDDSALMVRLTQERGRAVREYIEMLCHDEGYWCFVCGRFLPANEDGVIVHDNVPHPEEMTFDEEERPQ